MKPRMTPWLRGALQLIGLMATVPAAAAPMQPSAAPASWVRYAEGATRAISQWLESDEDRAVRLRERASAGPAQTGGAAAPIVLQLWIDPHGTISRIAFAPATDEQVNTDIQGLVTGRSLGAPPPPDMRQPIYVAIELQSAPAPEPTEPTER